MNGNARIAELVRVLRETEAELQALTGGEVDAVATVGGKTYLLSEAQEQLRQALATIAVTEALHRQVAESQSAILNALPAHVALVDAGGKIVSVNESWRRFAASNSFVGTNFGVGENYLKICENARGNCAEEGPAALRGIRSVLRGEAHEFALEYPCHSSSEQRWFRLMVAPLREGAGGGAVVMHVNITARKLAEAKVERLKRLYQVASEINAAIVRTPDTQQLFERACRIAVGGDLVMAWVGLLQPETGELQPAARWGRGAHFLDQARFSTREVTEGAGPDGKAFRDGTFFFSNNLASDPDYRPWRDAALECGFQSGAAFALKFEDRPIGIFAVFGGVPGYFDREELQLLRSLAENLSFAIASHRREAARQKAEAALAASESTMAIAQSISHFGSWELDLTIEDVRNPDALKWSDEMFRIVGLRPEESSVTRESFFNMVHPDDRQAVRAAVAAAIREGGRYSVEHRLLRPGGEERIVQEAGLVFYAEETGQAARLVGTAHDVTEQRRLARQFDEEHARLVAAQRVGKVGSWEVDLAASRVIWSEEMHRIFETDPETFKPSLDSIFKLIHPEDRPDLETIFAKSLADARPQTIEHRILTPSGCAKIVEASWEVQRNQSGAPVRAIGTSRDITERKTEELKLKEQAALLDQAQDAILVRDLDHRITYWNKSAERLFGWAAAEILGKSALETIHRDAAAFSKAMEKLLAASEWSGEFTTISRTGREVIVETRWTLVRDPQGRPQAILAIKTDVTEKKRLELQFLRAQRMEGIGTLAGGIAHDLNNVFAPIMMAVELLKGSVPESDLEFLRTLEISAQRGADLVKQVLSFARGVEGQRVSVNLLHLLRELLKVMRDTFPKSLSFHFAPPKEIWTVLGDPTQLHQVFLNLCVNARDAMPNGGRLSISAENLVLDETYSAMTFDAKPGSYVAVQFSDTGAGIPGEIQEKIFEPFFTTKEVGKGTGLGLSTTLAIVKSHGGFINLYSEEGKGARFKVYLPAQTTPGAAEAVAVQKSGLPRGRGETILVVDDEETIRSVTKSTLERFGYRVLLANNGAEAISVYVQHPREIAAVLTDMAMPIMDGPALIVALKALDPHVKIIGSSGLATHQGVAKAVGAGVQHFVPKPYTADALLRILDEVLRKNTETLNNKWLPVP